jgi:hypothetical protein
LPWLISFAFQNHRIPELVPVLLSGSRTVAVAPTVSTVFPSPFALAESLDHSGQRARGCSGI